MYAIKLVRPRDGKLSDITFSKHSELLPVMNNVDETLFLHIVPSNPERPIKYKESIPLLELIEEAVHKLGMEFFLNVPLYYRQDTRNGMTFMLNVVERDSRYGGRDIIISSKTTLLVNNSVPYLRKSGMQVDQHGFGVLHQERNEIITE